MMPPTQPCRLSRAAVRRTRADGDRWRTVRTRRTVLAVVHDITSATRLLDLLAVFAGDPPVETVFTCTGSRRSTGAPRSG